jgi:hypothetical protein
MSGIRVISHSFNVLDRDEIKERLSTFSSEAEI